MLQRSLLILLLPLFLFACQPKEPVVVEAKKDVTVKKEEIKVEAAIVCPAYTELKNGQCLCNEAAMAPADAANWLCVEGTWTCFKVGGCALTGGVCGFAGELVDGKCGCMGNVGSEKMLGDYLCRNKQWICDKKEGCGQGANACAYGKTCFGAVGDCFGVKRTEDVANYRCENKLWICRHTMGCDCRDTRIAYGEQCLDDGAFCGGYEKPEKGNYKCVGACLPELTDSHYQWLCQDSAGCPCGEGICGFGANCTDGACICGENYMPEAQEQYRCYSARSVGINNDEVDDLGYWICNVEDGCKCGGKTCAMGESCFFDKRCEVLDANRPKHYEKFVYENDQWTCHNVEGCPCGETLCAKNQSCNQGQCSCDGVRDCTQSVCSDGKCGEELSCGTAAAPKHPGYLCKNEAWICDSDVGCFCGNNQCKRGIECRDGQCLCGVAKNAAPTHFETYTCNKGQWTCDSLGGCICGGNFAPRGSICKDSKVYCGDAEVKDGKGYACETKAGKAELLCLRAPGTACACGDQLCPSGTICDKGQCRCGNIMTPVAKADGYVCQADAFVCGMSSCKCGENSCGRFGQCKDGQCVCGPNATAAPKDASNYTCSHYGSGASLVVKWICTDEKGCKCGDAVCGHGAVCVDDKNCLCGDQLAPSTNPEKYRCEESQELWACNDKKGCAFAGGTCPYLHMIEGTECVAPSSDDELCPEGECDASDACLGTPRPPKGKYVCVDQVDELASPELAGWTCTDPKGCPCGDEERADICRSQCMRSDDGDVCLEYKWTAEYLPICEGPDGIGNDDSCVDSCAGTCNGFEAPSSPGYACDGRAWICGEKLCACGLTLCAEGYYCVGDTHCTR